MLKQVVLVTGASSGFGFMAASALAEVGHTVYASMRETQGRNAARVSEVAAWSNQNGLDLRTVELDVQSDGSAEAGIAHVVVARIVDARVLRRDTDGRRGRQLPPPFERDAMTVYCPDTQNK